MMWTSDEEFWTADCRCGNYCEEKLRAMARERDKALATIAEMAVFAHHNEKAREREDSYQYERDDLPSDDDADHLRNGIQAGEHDRTGHRSEPSEC